MVDKKFSDFTDGGSSQDGDILVGLRSGVNTKFTSGGYQPNNGVLSYDFSVSGNLVLTNPAIQTIVATGQSDNTSSITFPAMNAINSWKEGNNVIKIRNNSTTWPITLKYNDGTALFTINAGLICEAWVLSNASANGVFSVLTYSPTEENLNNTTQPNNGQLTWNYAVSGNLILTNPAATLITLTNANTTGYSLTFPNMTETAAWQSGVTCVYIFNNSTQSIDIKNHSGTVLYTLSDSDLIQVNVLSNSTVDGQFTLNVIGTAASKNVTNSVKPLVVSMNGTGVIGNLPAFSDTTGTIQNSGKGPNSFQLNNGFSSISLASGNLTLTNPFPAALSFSGQVNNTTNVILPQMNQALSYQVGQFIRFFNADTTHNLNIKYNSGASLITLLPNTGANFTVASNATSDGVLVYTVPLLANNNLADLASVSQSLINLGLSPSNTPTFNSLLVSGNTPIVEILNNSTPSTALNEQVTFYQLNASVSPFNTASIIAQATSIVAGSEQAQLSITLPDGAGGTATPLLLTKDGLKDTQLNFTNSTKITNSQNALNLGVSNFVQFARVSVEGNSSVNPVYLAIYDDRTATTSAATSIEFFQKNNLGTAYNPAIISVTSTDVTSANATGKLQIEMFQSGSFVSDALTLTGSGLQDTQLNFTDATKISNSQTALKIIGLQDICGINVWPDPTQGAQLTMTTLTNYSSMAYNFVQSGFSYLYISIPMPKRWDGGAVTFIAGCSTSATTGNYVLFGEAAIINFGSTIDVGFGTAVSVTSSATAVANKLIKTTISSITPSGSFVAGDNNILLLRIHRNGGVGSDTMTASALLSSWYVVYNSTAGNDA